MRNNRLHALMLMLVPMNLLDKINLADVANDSVNRKDTSKQAFRHFSQNYSYYI